MRRGSGFAAERTKNAYVEILLVRGLGMISAP